MDTSCNCTSELSHHGRASLINYNVGHTKLLFGYQYVFLIQNGRKFKLNLDLMFVCMILELENKNIKNISNVASSKSFLIR